MKVAHLVIETAFGELFLEKYDNVEALQCWPDVFRGRALWVRLDLGRGEGIAAQAVANIRMGISW